MNGAVTLNGDGSVTFTPTSDFTGTGTFTYTIYDGNGGSSTATVTITVDAVADAPVAVADTYTVAEDTTLSIAASGVLGNDTDADGDTLTAAVVTTTANGTLTLNTNGSFSYVPNADFTGADTFTYKVNDGTADSNVVTVTINVTAANDPPAVAMTVAALVYEEGQGARAVDAGLTVADLDSPTLASARMTIAANFVAAQDALAFAPQGGITGSYNAATGVLTLSGSATVAQYQAALRSVTYRNSSTAPSTTARVVSVVVNDGASDSNVAMRSIAITTVNDTPTLDQPAAVTVNEDAAAFTIPLAGISAGGGESQTLTVSAVSANTSLFANPVVTYTSPAASATLTVTPLANAFGATTITVTVSDGSGGTVTRTVNVTITPVNDVPTLSAIGNRTGTPRQATTVSLEGIATGAANEADTLVVTAVSSDPSVVPHPAIAYASPSAAGSLVFTPATTGTATITVTVNDGASANATATRTFSVTVAANTPPTISLINDITITEGGTVPAIAFTIGDAETAATSLSVSGSSRNLALVTDGGLILGGSGASRTLTLNAVDSRIGETTVTLTVSDGELSTATAFRFIVRPRWDYYLLEGEAGDGAMTDIRITNPHDVAARIRMTFVRDDGTTGVRDTSVPARTRQSIRINEFAEAGRGSVSTFIKSLDDLPLLVERTIVWDATGYAGTSETALESTNKSWYFADGAEGPFSTTLVLANPNFEPTQIDVSFLVEGGSPVMRSYTLAAMSRRAIKLSTVPELTGRTFGMVVTSALAIAAERTVSIPGAHAAEGATVAAGRPYPSRTWYFAEGSSWRVFDTYVIVANPNEQAASFTIAYHTMTGRHFETTHQVAGRSRITIDALAGRQELDGEHYWMQLTADAPVVAERTMYWDRRSRWNESHGSHAVLEPRLKWWTGDARVGGPERYDTFLLLGNPSASAADLTITYYPDGAAPIVTTRRLPALGRDTVHVNLLVPELVDTSFWAIVESTNGVPIVMERSIYWHRDGEGSWAGGTNVAALPVVAADDPGCQVVLSTRELAINGVGGIGRVDVGATTRCTYTAHTSAGWLSVIEGASGNGLGTVRVQAARNDTGASRTATLTIAGLAIAILQEPANDTCVTDAPGPGWMCIGGTWRPSRVPPPVRGPMPSGDLACKSPTPGPDWVCTIAGGWVPPDHPLAQSENRAIDAATGTSTPPRCEGSAPDLAWVCTAKGGWVPPNHPLAIEKVRGSRF